MKPAFFLLLAALPSAAQTADEIMAKVAQGQERAEIARSSYVYRQNVLVRIMRPNGKLSREDDREYTVTPGPDGMKRELVRFAGKGEHYQDKDIDASMVKSLADDFGNDKKSRDGVNEDLFPLTAKKQRAYRFTLSGAETWKDHDVFRIAFEPRQAKEASWAGEALIDKTDLTPVLITTHLAKGVPLLVKTLLGTNVRQIGFRLSYEKFDGLWFPVSYSGEFKLQMLFFYGRTISVGLRNSEFQKADVKSDVRFEKQ